MTLNRLTKGEAELTDAFERAFAACKQAGLLVMVTTSHSAPCTPRGSNVPSRHPTSFAECL